MDKCLDKKRYFTVDDIQETLADFQMFSTFDIASSYWQVEVKSEDRRIKHLKV